MTTIQHGGPSGLQIGMRLAERRINPAFFVELRAAWLMERAQRGGVFQELLKRYSTTAFPYLSHSAVVILCESARPLRTREKGGDESDPPPKKTGGSCGLG